MQTCTQPCLRSFASRNVSLVCLVEKRSKGQEENDGHDQAFCKSLCEKEQPQEILESLSHPHPPHLLESLPAENHVWSLHSSPRQQTPANKNLVSSETSSVIQQHHSYLNKLLCLYKQTEREQEILQQNSYKSHSLLGQASSAHPPTAISFTAESSPVTEFQRKK